MTGKLIGGEEAERIGLANRVAPAGRARGRDPDAGRRAARCAPVAVGLAKRVMDASAKPALAVTLELEVTMQERCAATADFAEGAARVPREAPAGVQRALDDWFRGRCGRMAVSRGCWAVHGEGEQCDQHGPLRRVPIQRRGRPQAVVRVVE